MTHVVATFDQRTYRFRNDNGTETSATWKAAENATIIQPTDEVFRLRVEVQEIAGGSTNNATVVLHVSVNGGNFVNINASTTPVQLIDSAHVINQTPTTNQLTGGTGAFVPGTVQTAANGSNTSFAGNDHTEHEWSLVLDSGQISNNDTVTFRVTVDGNITDTASVSPSLTALAPPAPPENVQTAISGSDIIVTWNEISNAFAYNIERQLFDGNNWINTTNFTRLVNEFIDNTVVPDSLYRYRVQWVNSSLIPSKWSDWVEQASVSSQFESGASTVNVNISTEGQGQAELIGITHYSIGSNLVTGEISGQSEVGSSTVDINVSTESLGNGFISTTDSSTVDINVSVEGQGEAALEAVGASTVLVDVSTEGQGQGDLAATGSSTVVINVAAEGQGSFEQSQSESDASTVDISVSTEGQGQAKIEDSGSSTVDIDVTVEGIGQPQIEGSGSSTVVITVTPTGFGTGSQDQSFVGSSIVDVNISTEGAGEGTISAEDVSTVVINVTTEGFGTSTQEQNEVGSSTVNINISTESMGNGIISTTGASTVDIDITTESDGVGLLTASGDNTVTIDITSEGIGEGLLVASGSSTIPVEVSIEGTGTGTLSVNDFSTVDIIVTVTSQGVQGEALPRNITVEFNPPDSSDIEFNIPSIITNIDEPIVIIQIDSATLISPVEIAIPVLDLFSYDDARVLKDILEGELDTHIGEPTGV